MKLKLTITTLLFSSVAFFAQGIVTQNGLLKVNGNKIENKNGTIFSVAGNSMFWSSFVNDGAKFYEKSVVDHLATEWKTGVIRVAMGVEEADGSTIQNTDSNFPSGLSRNPGGEGYYNNPAKELAKVKTIIDAAIANDIYVIVDFHSHFAQFFKDDAISFFEEIARTYGNNDHIIYEIFNEPIGLADFRSPANDSNAFSQFNATWNTIIKPYAIDVIKAIRAIDPDNMIIVGTPGFSQGVVSAADNKITKANLGFTADKELNIAYTLHFYAATHGQFLRNQAKLAMDKGIALFVTEWGTVEASGSGSINLSETMTWLNFMKDNDISHANWSVSDKGGDTSSIIQGGFGIEGLLNNTLTPSGNLIRCVIENWNANSDFSSCNTSDGTTGGSIGNVQFPEGVGLKVDNGKSDAKSTTIASEIIEGSLVFPIKSGEFVAYNLKTITSLDLSQFYTIQFVVSAESGNNSLAVERDSGNVSIGSVAIPNTGKDTYTIVEVTGVKFVKDARENVSFAITHQGSGSGYKIESMYITADNDPALSVPSFNLDLAEKVSVYPIPSNNKVYVDAPSDKTVLYSIYTLNGKLISPKLIYNNVVDISTLDNGVYLLQLEIDNQTKTYKIVK